MYIIHQDNLHSGCGFISGHPIDSRPFLSMTIGPPIPEIQFDFEK